MSASESFEQKLAQAWPPQDWQDVTVVLAVSGGADSVALLRAIERIGPRGSGRLAVAHFNHHLRGEVSAADARFVAALCEQFGLPCEIGEEEVQSRANRQGDGLEAAAREARYEFLRRTAEKLGARYVATAHTADDQVETVLHRIIRGTGVRGLAGMPRTRRLGPATTLVRPLLDLRRTDVVAYLQSLGQAWREDASNLDVRHTRNRLRHEVLPLLASEFNPNIDQALSRLARLAGECQAVVDRMVEEVYEASVERLSERSVSIDPAPLADQPRYLVRELVMAVWREQAWPMQAMSLAAWDQLAAMLLDEPASATRSFPGAIQARREVDRLVLKRE